MKKKLIFQIFICLSFMIPLKNMGQDISSIVIGVDTLNGGSLGSIYALNEKIVPLATAKYLNYSIATEYKNGRVIAIGHDGALVNESMAKYDQLQFMLNSIKWLNKTNKKTILVKNGWASISNMSTFLNKLKVDGYTVSTLEDNSNLTNVGIIIFGNDWNGNVPYNAAFITKIDDFVKNGGGVLMAGLGWSFGDLNSYAMNSIGAIFGFRFGGDLMYVPYVTDFYSASNKPLTTMSALNNLKTISAEYSTNLPVTLQNNETIKTSFTLSNNYLKGVLDYLPDDSNLRDSIYDCYTYLISNYPMYQKGKAYNTTIETAMAWNRERMQENLHGAKELTNKIIGEIGTTLALTGDYLYIWRNHHVLLNDNSKLSVAQLKFTKEILDAIPSKMYDLGRISFSDYIGSANMLVLDNKYKGVNSFSYPIGAVPQNQFPADISDGTTAVFCSALAHEVNHNVNSYYISGNENLRKRQEQLISQAGTIAGNYLRSEYTMASEPFFVSNPQEFFASMSNQWFTNSKKVLELALSRFDRKYLEPINQFLFYADVYSLNSDSTIFYLNDLNANFSSRKIPIKRDSKNHINSIKIDNNIYSFNLDDLGNVLEYSKNISINDTVMYYVSSPEFEAVSPKTIFEGSQIIKTQSGEDSIINHYSKFVYNPTFFSDTTFVSVTDTLIIDITLTGIASPYNTNTIKIYPNPAHSFIIINTGNYNSMSDYTIRVQNILGKQVYKTLTNQPEFQIDVKSFGGYGTYIVEVKDNSNNIIATRKIVLN